MTTTSDVNVLARDETKRIGERIQGSSFSNVSVERLILVAAEWLSLHRHELDQKTVIVEVKSRFALSNNDAVEALRRGNVLRHARAL